ncbi:MAG: hypothetical protein J1F04_05240 [Oscillospiraceae bacterium]|nr:hypothetical protein [Oscillospiraceae bacterium]
MGRFSTTVHIQNNIERIRLVNTFCDIMKKRGFAPCSEDEAAVSYLFAFGEDWVTLANEDYKDNPKKSSADIREISAALKTIAFSVEVVDSDFAVLKLFCGSYSDEVVVGDGSGYGIEEPSRGNRECWEPLLAGGKMWEEFSQTAEKENTFVEDTLAELAEILGIAPDYICADYSELSEGDSNENLSQLHFKKAKEKSMTLNAAFIQVFGEALEPLGFKKIKGRYPYFVRVVNDEIIHYVSVGDETADGRGDCGVRYKCFNVFCGVWTVYNSDIDFITNTKIIRDSISDVYTRTHWCDCDMNYRASIMAFYYNPTDTKSIINALKRALAVTEKHVLPVIGEAVTLEQCMDYLDVMGHYIYPTLGSSDESLLCTRLFTADEYVMFCDRSREREIAQCRSELDSHSGLTPKRKMSLETRIKIVMEERDERKKKDYEIFTNPELQERAPAELERRKAANTELLRSYGLEL